MSNKGKLNQEIEHIEDSLESEYHVSWFIIAFKLIAGALELAFGIAIMLLGRPAFVVYRDFLQEELVGEAHGTIARITERALPYIFANHTSLSFYLCLLGLAKVIGALALIRGKDWGADLLILLTIILFPFQVIQFVMKPSFLELGYIVVGILIALYLVNFKPKEWAISIVKRASKNTN